MFLYLNKFNTDYIENLLLNVKFQGLNRRISILWSVFVQYVAYVVATLKSLIVMVGLGITVTGNTSQLPASFSVLIIIHSFSEFDSPR